MILNTIYADNSQSQCRPENTQTSLLHSNPTSKCLLDSSFRHLSGTPNLLCPKRHFQAPPPKFVSFHLSKGHYYPLKWVVRKIGVSLSSSPLFCIQMSKLYLKILSQMHQLLSIPLVQGGVLSPGLPQSSPNWFQRIVSESELKPKAMGVFPQCSHFCLLISPLIVLFYCQEVRVLLSSITD